MVKADLSACVEAGVVVRGSCEDEGGLVWRPSPARWTGEVPPRDIPRTVISPYVLYAATSCHLLLLHCRHNHYHPYLTLANYLCFAQSSLVGQSKQIVG